MHTTHSLVPGVSSGLGAVGVRGVLGVKGGVSCCCIGTVGMKGPGSCSSLNLGEFLGEVLGESVGQLNFRGNNSAWLLIKDWRWKTRVALLACSLAQCRRDFCIPTSLIPSWKSRKQKNNNHKMSFYLESLSVTKNQVRPFDYMTNPR